MSLAKFGKHRGSSLRQPARQLLQILKAQRKIDAAWSNLERKHVRLSEKSREFRWISLEIRENLDVRFGLVHYHPLLHGCQPFY